MENSSNKHGVVIVLRSEAARAAAATSPDRLSGLPTRTNEATEAVFAAASALRDLLGDVVYDVAPYGDGWSFFVRGSAAMHSPSSITRTLTDVLGSDTEVTAHPVVDRRETGRTFYIKR